LRAGHRIGSEQDARYLRNYRLLDHDDDGSPAVKKALALPISDGVR
jgi:hypothetical protein